MRESFSSSSSSEIHAIFDFRSNNRVSLCSNFIDDYDSISFLFLCPRLESLVLMGNPVADEPEYRDEA